jgi:MraZ protein
VFQGEYEHSTDDKGRVIMPAKFRAILGDKFVMCKGFDSCVWVYPELDFSAMCERLRAQNSLSEHALRVQRRLMASFEVSTDSQGRVAIPQKLRQYAGISDQSSVSVIGLGDRVEIWHTAAWEAYNDGVTDDMVRESAREVGIV